MSSPVSSSFWQRLAAVLVAFWAGSLWSVCAVVAPSLFVTLDDRHLAGQLAGRLFHLEMMIGIATGAALLALAQFSKILLPARGLVWVAALLPVAGTLVVGPFMAQARAAGHLSLFALLHGLSAGCFLMAAVALVAFVWKFSPPAE